MRRRQRGAEESALQAGVVVQCNHVMGSERSVGTMEKSVRMQKRACETDAHQDGFVGSEADGEPNVQGRVGTGGLYHPMTLWRASTRSSPRSRLCAASVSSRAFCLTLLDKYIF
jgi:hypothetical protein